MKSIVLIHILIYYGIFVHNISIDFNKNISVQFLNLKDISLLSYKFDLNNSLLKLFFGL